MVYFSRGARSATKTDEHNIIYSALEQFFLRAVAFTMVFVYNVSSKSTKITRWKIKLTYTSNDDQMDERYGCIRMHQSLRH